MWISPLDTFNPRKSVVFIGFVSVVVIVFVECPFYGCLSFSQVEYNCIFRLHNILGIKAVYFFLCKFNILYDNIRKSLLCASMPANVLAYYISTYLTYVSCIHYLICQKLNINQILMKINSPDNSFFTIFFPKMMMVNYNIVEVSVQNIKLKT